MPIRFPMLLPAAIGAAAFLSALMAGTALAGGSHAAVDYPSAERIGAESGVNVRGFGRLFAAATPETTDGLIPHPSPRYDLLRLGNAMIEDDPEGAQPSEMPVAYVFLGQFIDHDLTFDTVTGFDALAVVSTVENARTPDLDLDCVYGGGPERMPFLYDGPYLRRGAIVVDKPGETYDRFDLLRAEGGAPTALIGDPRNDENFAIAQLQAAFVAYHNRMVDRLLDAEVAAVRALVERALEADAEVAAGSADGSPIGRMMAEEDARAEALARFASRSAARRLAVAFSAPAAAESDGLTPEAVLEAIDREAVLEDLEADRAAEEALFEEARGLTIHHYHRVIVEDFVPRIIGIARTRDILERGRLFYQPQGFRRADGTMLDAFIPIEFAVAAYRFMHSQVPSRLALRGSGGNAVSAALFSADKGGQSPSELRPDGFTPVRTDAGSLVISWERLLDLAGATTPSGDPVERANRIDTTLVNPLGKLDLTGIVGPGGLGNLAGRNLSRGRTYLLPSGQDLAKTILAELEARGTLDDIYVSDNGTGAAAFVLPVDPITRETLGIRATPLWYYVLQEAASFGGSLAGAASTLAVQVKLVAAPEDEETQNDAAGAPTGATLGPVGATIVGETLLGLVEHYRETTGEGLDADVPFGYTPFPFDGDLAAGGVAPLALTETPPFEIENETFGRRYFLRNFMRDAGVAVPVEESEVCTGRATSPTALCVQAR